MWCHLFFFGFPIFGLVLFALLPFPLAAATYLVFSALSLGAGALVMRALRAPPSNGAEAMPGRIGRVEALQGEQALVRVDGELWNAVCRDGALALGQAVVVERVDRLTVVVRRALARGPGRWA